MLTGRTSRRAEASFERGRQVNFMATSLALKLIRLQGILFQSEVVSKWVAVRGFPILLLENSKRIGTGCVEWPKASAPPQVVTPSLRVPLAQSATGLICDPHRCAHE